jgi:hypothetical protein
VSEPDGEQGGLLRRLVRAVGDDPISGCFALLDALQSFFDPLLITWWRKRWLSFIHECSRGGLSLARGGQDRRCAGEPAGQNETGWVQEERTRLFPGVEELDVQPVPQSDQDEVRSIGLGPVLPEPHRGGLRVFEAAVVLQARQGTRPPGAISRSRPPRTVSAD